jgi:prepilin-type N-terminal cleavage/methylation domain-containing protein
MNLNMKSNKGFTLIELLLVMSIISLLSSIIISQVQDSRKKAITASIRQEISSFRNEAEIYYTSNLSYAPTEQDNLPCPTSQDPGFGFLGTEKGIELVNSLKSKTKTASANCSVNTDSYSISIDLESYLASNNILIQNAYAASTGLVCLDSSGNTVIDIFRESILSVSDDSGVSDGPERKQEEKSSTIIKKKIGEKVIFTCRPL